ncbi:hypothetical protein V7Y60_25270, partial [Priestia megaterium]|uniref:hypothetical protein n=1 Tax=Priestia megaterium TaxID=1404 RepID=UPI003000F46C
KRQKAQYSTPKIAKVKSGTPKTAKVISIHLKKGKKITSLIAVNNTMNFNSTSKMAKAIFST